MNITEIQSALNKGNIEYSLHVQKRMLERGISRDDIKNCIKTGKIIEDYPVEDNMPSTSFPSCLIKGNMISNGILHIIIGFDGKKILLITAYFPDIVEWNATFDERKK